MTKQENTFSNLALDIFHQAIADYQLIKEDISKEWKDISGCKNYFINKFGEVRRIDGTILHLRPIGRKGYLAARIQIKGKRKYVYVHQAVAKAFIPNPENKPVVNHIDGNRLNNNLSNLEWATYSENLKHAYKMGLRKPNHERNSGMYVKGSNVNPKSKKEGGLCEV